MGTCLGKPSKHKKSLSKKEEVYKPRTCNEDTDNEQGQHDNGLLQGKKCLESSEVTTLMVNAAINDKEMKQNLFAKGTLMNEPVENEFIDKKDSGTDIQSKDRTVSPSDVNVSTNVDGNHLVKITNKTVRTVKPKKDVKESTFKISVKINDILYEVSKSVGHIYGRNRSATCGRYGEDIILTALHFVQEIMWQPYEKWYNEAELNNIYVTFDYVDKHPIGSTRFKVEPKVYMMDERLDVAILRLKKDEHLKFPPALPMFYWLDPKKDSHRKIFLIGHDRGKKKSINGNIPIWTPTEEAMAELKQIGERYGKANGYDGLDSSGRVVIKADFVHGASGSPGIIMINGKPYVAMILLRGFPDFYYEANFSQEEKNKFPQNMLFEQGICPGTLYDALACNLPLRDEIFSLEVDCEASHKGHEYAMAGNFSKDGIIITSSEAPNNIAVTNPSHNSTDDLAKDPAGVQHTTLHEGLTSHVLLSGEHKDMEYDNSSAVKHLSRNLDVHSGAIGETDVPQVQVDETNVAIPEYSKDKNDSAWINNTTHDETHEDVARKPPPPCDAEILEEQSQSMLTLDFPSISLSESSKPFHQTHSLTKLSCINHGRTLEECSERTVHLASVHACKEEGDLISPRPVKSLQRDITISDSAVIPVMPSATPTSSTATISLSHTPPNAKPVDFATSSDTSLPSTTHTTLRTISNKLQL